MGIGRDLGDVVRLRGGVGVGVRVVLVLSRGGLRDLELLGLKALMR